MSTATRPLAVAAVLLHLSAGLLTAQSAAGLTVDQAVAMALANQPLIQQAQAAVEAARARVGEAQSTYYPSVSGSASYNRIADQSFSITSVLPPGVPLSAFGVSPGSPLDMLLSSPLSLAPDNNWDFNVGLNQVVYQFGKREIQVKLAENGVSAAQVGVEQIQLGLAFQTVQLFYSILFIKDQLAALDSQMQNLQEHLEGVQARMQTGSATRYDELSTDSRITVLQSQRIDAQSVLEKQMIGLRQLLGMDSSAPLELSGDFTTSSAAPDEKALLESGMANRPEVRQAAEAESAAELNRRMASAATYPTLSAHASIGYKTGILPDINSLSLSWVAGLQLNVPVFQGFYEDRLADEADQRLRAAREGTIAARRTVTTQVLQAVQDLKTAREQVDSARAELDQAQQVVDVVKVQYDLGLLTNLEFLDAQAGLERAQLGSLQAQYREVLGEYALRQATGEKIWLSSANKLANQ